MTGPTVSTSSFGDDPGTDKFTVYVNGVLVDPTTLPGYVATGPTISITQAALTGDWTIRDDGLIEYVRPMTAPSSDPSALTAKTSPPSNMCVVVCDKTGVVVRIEGSLVPAGVVLGQPLPVIVPTTIPEVAPTTMALPVSVTEAPAVTVTVTTPTETKTVTGATHQSVIEEVLHWLANEGHVILKDLHLEK